MTETITSASTLLSDAGYSIGVMETDGGTVTTFENNTVLGFIFFYPDAKTLISEWSTNSIRVLDHAQFSLRAAGVKAWNTYLILLADKPADYSQNINLRDIEEDLVGTRKIARAGVISPTELRYALMPLLAIQNAPGLEKVDMEREIRLRTSEFPVELVDGFLSEASDNVLLQMLERGE
ncbi:MAG: hypothetical protein OXN16_02745 [Gammaproteobacteria bacterium]|nr:hypothetical protein [Gammaproteobacteria bacterium]